MDSKPNEGRCDWFTKSGKRCTRQGRNWYAPGRYFCRQHFDMVLKAMEEVHEIITPGPQWPS